MLPPIKAQEGRGRMSWAYTHRVEELTNQVLELQQELAEAISGSHLQKILQNHSSETRCLQELLGKARVDRGRLAQRLRATEDELMRSKDALRRLELLHRDQSLEKQNQLTLKLAQATADREGRTRRIQDLERNLQLNQASSNRQIAAERRKTNEARQVSDHLKKQNCQLTQQLKARERELAIKNIYSHRLPKGLNRKDEKQGGLSIKPSGPDVDAYLAVEAGPSTQDLEREKPKPSDSHCFPSSENIINKGLKPPLNRRQYTFKETTLNLHNGKPAYSRHVHTVRRSPLPVIESQAGVDDLGSSGYKPSFLTRPTRTGLGQVRPQAEEVGFQRKKRSLMKELFGRGQITDPLPVQRSRSRGQRSGLDTDKPHLASEMDEDLA